MKYLSLLSLIAPLAAAAPLEANADPALAAPSVAPSSVRVVGVSLLGSGCPAGTADVQIDGTYLLPTCPASWILPILPLDTLTNMLNS